MGRHGRAGGQRRCRWPQPRPVAARPFACALLTLRRSLSRDLLPPSRALSAMSAMSAMSSDSRDVIGRMSPRSRSPARDRRAPRPPRAPGGEDRAAGCQNRGHKNRVAIKPARESPMSTGNAYSFTGRPRSGCESLSTDGAEPKHPHPFALHDGVHAGEKGKGHKDGGKWGRTVAKLVSAAVCFWLSLSFPSTRSDSTSRGLGQ
jgi:hypothetical protein